MNEPPEIQTLWQHEPVTPGSQQRVIDARATDAESLAPYTLTCTEAGGDRSITLHGVTFPELRPPSR